MEKEEKSVERAPGWSWFVLIGICLLFLIFGGVKSCKENREKKAKAKIERSEKAPVWVIEKKQVVYFGNDYVETIYLSEGENLSFENSSEPYCVKNLSEQEFCAEKGEDVGSQMPNNISNMQLRFKSGNGETGQVTIVFWILE